MKPLLCVAAVLTAVALPAVAEDDGEEFLKLMRTNRPKARELAQKYIDNAADKWDGSVFCTPEEDRANARFNAVKAYFEANEKELWRPQRYLIIQGLRAAFPCHRS
ncbi:MAG: Rap1a/Tai family immunity protein [Burkholderiales bacterium]